MLHTSANIFSFTGFDSFFLHTQQPQKINPGVFQGKFKAIKCLASIFDRIQKLQAILNVEFKAKKNNCNTPH